MNIHLYFFAYYLLFLAKVLISLANNSEWLEGMNYEELFRSHPEARSEIVSLVHKGISKKRLAENLGVSKQCIYNWCTKERDLESTHRDPKFKITETMLEGVLHEVATKTPEEHSKDRDMVKKVLKSSPDLRLEVVRLADLGYCVADLARRLGVSAPTIDYWRDKVNGTDNTLRSDLEELRNIIYPLQNEVNQQPTS